MSTKAHMRKVAALLYDKEFEAKLEETQNTQKIISLFHDRGVHVNREDLIAIAAFIKREHGEELTDEDNQVLQGRGIGAYDSIASVETRSVYKDLNSNISAFGQNDSNFVEMREKVLYHNERMLANE